MTNETSEKVTALLLRDSEGNIYLLGEDAIRACRATPEQQEELSKAISDQDVAGYVGGGGFSPVGSIVVAPQINVQTGLNLAVLSPGAQQALAQGAGNNLFAVQV